MKEELKIDYDGWTGTISFHLERIYRNSGFKPKLSELRMFLKSVKEKEKWMKAFNTRVYKERKLKKKYGVSYWDEFAKQRGVCAIRGSNNNGKNLYFDHCHNTGKFRGLLCASCNCGIGHMKDDVSILISAVKYLQERT